MVILSGGNFYHSYFFLVHIRLSWLVCSNDTMMRFKLSGGGRGSGVCWNWSHHHQEEDEMARAGVLAFLLSGWQERKREKSSQGLEDIQNSLSFQLAIWVIIITDWLYKKQTFGSKTKKKPKKTTTAKFGSCYTCNPKCFDLTLVLSLQTSAVVFSAEKVHAGKM